VDVGHGLHYLVTHVKTKLAHFAFFDHPAVFSLSLPRCCAYSVPPYNLFCGELWLLDIRLRRLRRRNVLLWLLQRMVWVRLLMLLRMRMLLLGLLVGVGGVSHHAHCCIPVSLPFATLPFSSLLPLDPLTLGFALAGPLA